MKTIHSNCTFSEKSFVKKELNEMKNFTQEQLLQIKPELENVQKEKEN